VGNTAVDLANAKTSGGASLDHTVTFTVDGEPYEIVSVKNGNKVNVPYSITDENGVPYGWFIDEQKVEFPYKPTENVILDGKSSGNLVPTDLNNWNKNPGASDAYRHITYDINTNENVIDYYSTSNLEYVYFPVSFEKGKTYLFSVDYKIENLSYVGYGRPFRSYISFTETLGTESTTIQWDNIIAGKEVDSPASADYVTYTITYQPLENFDGYATLDTSCIIMNTEGTLYIKNLVVKQVVNI
jgi:hypothetical protein